MRCQRGKTTLIFKQLFFLNFRAIFRADLEQKRSKGMEPNRFLPDSGCFLTLTIHDLSSSPSPFLISHLIPLHFPVHPIPLFSPISYSALCFIYPQHILLLLSSCLTTTSSSSISSSSLCLLFFPQWSSFPQCH